VGKKDELADLVDDILDNVGEDRERLSNFLDKLLSEHGDQPAGIAEYVAKIAAELSRQNQVRVNTVKALGKALETPSDDDEDGIADEIGRPFPEEDFDEGSN
jgi:hypothetical protein